MKFPLFALVPAAGLLAAEAPRVVVKDREAHQQRVEIVTTQLDPNGNALSETNSYVQLESGLNFRNAQGEWEESRAEFVSENGWAVAKRGQHKVALYHNLNVEGAVVLHSPEGKRLRSHVYGLAFYDTASGQSVLIASVKDAEAQLVTDNELVYADAFTELAADVRYTYTKAGFEQDIILREQPPAPEQFGFNPETTRLEVWTEFVEAERPGKSPRTLNPEAVAQGAEAPLVDEDLSFGELKIGQGRTFALGREDEALSLVAKNWIETEDGGKFLVETVAVDSVSAGLEQLPAGKGGAQLRKPHRGRLHAGYRAPARPAAREAVQVSIPRLDRGRDVARLDAWSRPGLVLDYVAVSGTFGSYTFQSDETYYLSGNTTVSGAAVIEGGAVFKLNSATSSLTLQGTVNLETTEFRPAIFTAKDDNSVGQTISGSTGNPTLVHYGSTTGALVIQNGTGMTLQHLRFSHQKQALKFASGTGYTVRHLQVARCQDGIAPVNTANVQNALFVNVDKVVAGTATTTVQGQHWTVNASGQLKGNASATINLLNSLLVQLATSPTSPTPSFVDTAAPVTSVRVLTSNAGVFQVAGGGAHYLSAASPYRKAGSAGGDTTLVTQLRGMTTEAPLVINTAVSVDTAWWRRGQRDLTASDLGYHYPAVDYLVTGATLTAKLTLAEGTVAAAAGNHGLRLQGNSQLLSNGRAEAMNTLTRYTALQESALAGDTGGSFFKIDTGYWQRPIIKLAFNRILTAGGYFTLLDAGSTQPFNTLQLEHCQLRNIGLNLWPVDTYAVTVTFRNNLFERCNLSVNKSYYSANTPLTVTARNNLFWRGSLAFTFDYSAGGNNYYWTFKDNLLDNPTNSLTGASGGTGYVSRSHNGFVAGTTTAFASGATDKVNLTADYLPNGTLGNRYYPTTVSSTSLSALIGAGSQTHTAAGLTYFTVKTAAFSHENQDTTTVDIGYHYPAQDSSGKLLDSDQDGLADYLEDSNNNGTKQATETGHLLADSDGDGLDDGEEFRLGLDPLSSTDGLKRQLASWRFNSSGADRFYSEQGDVTFAGSTAVPEVNSWDGDAAAIPSSTSGTYLGYAWRDTAGRKLLNPTRGTVQFWFKPNWNSGNPGDGVSTWRKLVTVQAQADEQEFWAIELNSAGTQLRFQNKTTSGTARPALTAAVSLAQHQWRLFTVVYDATGVELWLDKTKLAFDTFTVGAWPSTPAVPLDRKVWIGGWNNSTSPSKANGSFENIAFYNYRFTQAQIEDVYQQAVNVDADGDGLGDIKELATHFLPSGDRFLPGNRDSDGDGLPDSWEYLHFQPPQGSGSWTNPTASGDPDGDTLTNFQEFLRGRDPKVADAGLVANEEMPFLLVGDVSELINIDFVHATRPGAQYGNPGTTGLADDEPAMESFPGTVTLVNPVAATTAPTSDQWNLILPGAANMSLKNVAGTLAVDEFKVGTWFGPVTYYDPPCPDYHRAAVGLSSPPATPNPGFSPGGESVSADQDQPPPESQPECTDVVRRVYIVPPGMGEGFVGDGNVTVGPWSPWLPGWSAVYVRVPYCRPRIEPAPNLGQAGLPIKLPQDVEVGSGIPCAGRQIAEYYTGFRSSARFPANASLTDATQHPMFKDYQIGNEQNRRSSWGDAFNAYNARTMLKLSAIPTGPWRVVVYSGAANNTRKATITIGSERCYLTGGPMNGSRFEKGKHYVQSLVDVNKSGEINLSFDDYSAINGLQLVKVLPPADPAWDYSAGDPATANAAGMIVRWTHTAGATSYELWRATGNSSGPTSNWTLVADNLRVHRFVDAGAVVGLHNYYRVVARNELFSTTGTTLASALFSTAVTGNRAPYLGHINPVSTAWRGKRFSISLPAVRAAAVVSDYEGQPILFRIEGLGAGRLWVNDLEVSDATLKAQAFPPGTPANTHDPLKYAITPNTRVEWEAPDGEAELVEALQLRAFDGALFSQTSAMLPVEVKPALEVTWWGSRFQNTAGTGQWVDIQTAMSRDWQLRYFWQNEGQWWSKFPAPIDGPDQDGTRLEEVVQLASVQGVTLALKADGKLYSWGTGSALLGNGLLFPAAPVAGYQWFQQEAELTPKQIWPVTETPPVAPAAQVAAGSAHAALVTTDGKVYLWGETTVYSHGLNEFGTLSLAEEHLASKPTEALRWPYDPDSRLTKDDFVTALPKPTQVKGLANAVGVACSDYATAVLTASGAIYDWGSLLYFDDITPCYLYGFLQSFGYRPVSPSGTPQLKALPQNQKAIQLAAGSQAFLALSDTGEVYAWGANDTGAFGDPAWVFAPVTATAGTDTPRKVPHLPTSVIQIAAYGNYFAALTREGSVYEWGSLGEQTVPKARTVKGLPPVSKLMLTWERAFALDHDGKVWGWGRNRGSTGRWGEHAGLLLPDDQRLHLIDPVQMADLKNVRAVSSVTPYNLHASTERLPNAPQGLTAVGKDARIELAWQRFEGASAYRVYASPTATGTYVYKVSVGAGELATQGWSDTSIANGQESYYKITAVVNGVETPLSAYTWGRAVAPPAFPASSVLVLTQLSRELKPERTPGRGCLTARPSAHPVVTGTEASLVSSAQRLPLRHPPSRTFPREPDFRC